MGPTMTAAVRLDSVSPSESFLPFFYVRDEVLDTRRSSPNEETRKLGIFYRIYVPSGMIGYCNTYVHIPNPAILPRAQIHAIAKNMRSIP